MLSGERQQPIRVNDQDIEENRGPSTHIQEDNANYLHLWGSRKIEKRIAYQLILAVIAALIIIALATAFFTTFHW